MIFPELVFTGPYSDKDRRLYTFIIHSVVREYFRKFPSLDKVKKINVMPDMPADCHCIGNAIFQTDTINVALKPGASQWEINSYGSLVSHEFGHHYLQEEEGDTAAGNVWGNNGIHWNENKQSYFYTKRYFSPSFFLRYGVPFVSISYHDLEMLTMQKQAIKANIAAGGGRGFHPIW